MWAGYFKTGKSKSKNLQEQSQVQRPGSPSKRLSLGGKREQEEDGVRKGPDHQAGQGVWT